MAVFVHLYIVYFYREAALHLLPLNPNIEIILSSPEVFKRFSVELEAFSTFLGLRVANKPLAYLVADTFRYDKSYIFHVFHALSE